jgi:hypothetical protein
MAFVKKTFAPEQIEAARGLYQDPQTSLDAVAASLGITRRTLDARIVEWGWPPRSAAPPRGAGRACKKKPARVARRTEAARKQPEAASHPPTGPSRRPAATPAALAARVQRVVERELDAIDRVLSVLGATDSVEAERSARTLASLARALKEVMRLTAPEQTPEADEDDDGGPRDLEEFRRELARRLEALAAGAAAEAAGDGG